LDESYIIENCGEGHYVSVGNKGYPSFYSEAIKHELWVFIKWLGL